MSHDIARASEAETAFWLPGENGLTLAASSMPELREAALAAAFAARADVSQAISLGQPIDRLDLDFDGLHWIARVRPTAVEGEAPSGPCPRWHRATTWCVATARS